MKKILVLLFAVPSILSAASSFTMGVSSVPYTSINITGPTTETDNGTIMTFSFPWSGSELPYSGNTYAPLVASVTLNGTSRGIYAFPQPAPVGIPMTLEFNSSDRTAFLSGGTVVVTFAARYSSSQMTQITPQTYTFTYAGGTGGTITPTDLPVAAARHLSWTVTNNTGATHYWAIFQCTSASLSSYTGVCFDDVPIDPGGSWTFNFVVQPDDPDYYEPAMENLSVPPGSSNFTGNGLGTGYGYTPNTATTFGTPGDYVTASAYTPGTNASTDSSTPGTTGTGNGYLSGTSTATDTDSKTGYTGTPPTTTYTNPSATTATLGPGGTTSSTDTGIQNAANAINSQASLDQSYTDQRLAAIQDTLNRIAAQGSAASSGSSGGTDNAGIESDLATINSNLTQANTLATAANTAIASNPTTASMSSAGAAEGTAEAGDMPAGYTGGPSMPTTTEPNFTLSTWTLHGSSMPGFTADVFAGTAPGGGIGPELAGFRAALVWLVLASFGVYCFKGLRVYFVAAAQSRQAQGNSVAAGSGAQATGALAATLISAAVVTALTAMTGLLASASIGSVGSLFVSSHPWASMPAGSLWMLDRCFPVAMIASAWLGKLIFDAAASKIYVVCAAVVRFITP